MRYDPLRIALVVYLVALMLLGAASFHVAYGAPAEVCPEDGKVESVIDGDLDDIVLPAGTEVCIFGAATQVVTTADGSSTLYKLLGLERNVSHYTVLEEPPSTTTTTTSIPKTTTTTVSPTTTVPETTTTTIEDETSSTSLPDNTTTTTPQEETTTTYSDGTTTSTSQPTNELPRTGANFLAWGTPLGSFLMLAGLAALHYSTRSKE